MRWAKNLYLSEKAEKNKKKIIKKANKGIGMVSVYFITLASNEQNLLDIFHAAFLQQPAVYRQNFFVVGIAYGYDEAVELAVQIIDDLYRKTGTFKVREYFMETPE